MYVYDPSSPHLLTEGYIATLRKSELGSLVRHSAQMTASWRRGAGEGRMNHGGSQWLMAIVALLHAFHQS